MKQLYINCTGVSEPLCDVTGRIVACEHNVSIEPVLIELSPDCDQTL